MYLVVKSFSQLFTSNFLENENFDLKKSVENLKNIFKYYYIVHFGKLILRGGFRKNYKSWLTLYMIYKTLSNYHIYYFEYKWKSKWHLTTHVYSWIWKQVYWQMIITPKYSFIRNKEIKYYWGLLNFISTYNFFYIIFLWTFKQL